MNKEIGDEIFVFGSNLAGRHGAGFALHAKRFYGALQSIGEGRQGQSYAIPTKDKYFKVLPLSDIEKHVNRFLQYAWAHPELHFDMVEIGCGLAGYSATQIAPMFLNYPPNVKIPTEFMRVIIQHLEHELFGDDD